MAKRYYARFRREKGWHVICANNMEEATTKMLRGSRYSKSDVIIRAKKPRTKYPIAGIKTKLC